MSFASPIADPTKSALFIELIDLLRCPRQHEESWLVAAFNRMEGRFVIEGRLGCPICSANYLIADGVADLREHASHEARVSQSDPLSFTGHDDMALTIAAMLGLTRPGAFAVLEGIESEVGGIISEMTNTKVILLNSPHTQSAKENVGAVLSAKRLPFASNSVDGILISDNTGTNGLDEVLRVLKTGGRVAAPAETAMSGNIRELARDDRYVVAESTGPLLSLSR